MKINPINNPNIVKAYKSSQPMRSQQGPASSGIDEVAVSKEALSFAKTLAEVKGAMNDVPAVKRQQKLDEIAEKIRTGEYKVDSADVADKMVSDILGRHKG